MTEQLIQNFKKIRWQRGLGRIGWMDNYPPPSGGLVLLGMHFFSSDYTIPLGVFKAPIGRRPKVGPKVEMPG